MRKVKIFLGLLFCGTSLLAMEEQTTGFHAPEISAEMRTMVNELVDADKNTVGDRMRQYCKRWFFAPQVLAGETGANLLHRPGMPDALSMISGLVGGFLGWGLTLPVTIPTGILGSFAGSAYGFAKGISEDLKANKNEAKFEDVVTEHLIKWIVVVKNARQAMREQVIAYMKANDIKSVKKAVNDLLTADQLDNNIPQTMSKSDIEKLLAKIENENDCLGNFFNKLSEEVKTQKLSDNDWQYLETILSLQAPTMKDDIHTYLVFSVYFFKMMDDRALSILDSYIKRTKNNDVQTTAK
jgi:hypothetical protein